MKGASGKSEMICQYLESDIASGVLRSFAKLPTELAMCEQYQASRTTVRKALGMLLARKVIEKKGERSPTVARDAIAIIEAISRRNCARLIFLMTPDQQGNLLYADILRALEMRLRKEYQLRLVFRSIPGSFAWKPDDVVVINGTYRAEVVDELRSRVASVYSLNEYFSSAAVLSPDNRTGGRLAAEHLHKCGHRHILALDFEHIAPSDFSERLDGIRNYCGEHQLDLQTIRLPFSIFEVGKADTAKYLRYALEKFSQCTAIISLCDIFVLKIYEDLADLGLRIPETISVISFDDCYYAKLLDPALTSVKYPGTEIGVKLAAMINGGQVKPGPITPLLCVRESVAVIPARRES